MNVTAMNLNDLKLELGRDLTLMTEEEMANMFARGSDFPKIRKMREQLIIESLMIVSATMAAVVMSEIASGGPLAMVFVGFATMFVTAEIFGFRYFWKLPDAVNLKDSLVQDHRRMQRISTWMKIFNLSLGFVLLVIVLIDSNITNQVPLSALLTMFGVKIMAWLFSIKWMKRERQMRVALEEFEEAD